MIIIADPAEVGSRSAGDDHHHRSSARKWDHRDRSGMMIIVTDPVQGSGIIAIDRE
jgi:hypothetical protein